MWVKQHYRESQSRFADTYLDFVREYTQDYDALQNEIANLLIATRWCLEQQEINRAVELVNALSHFLLARGYWEEAATYADHAATAALQLLANQPNDEKLRLDIIMLRITGVVALWLMGERRVAKDKFKEIVANSDLMADETVGIGLGMVSGLLASVHKQDNEKITHYEAVLQQVRLLEYPPLTAIMLDMLAQAFAEQGAYGEALQLYQEKLQILHQTHDISDMIETLHGLSSIAKMAGLLELAESCLHDAAELAQNYSAAAQQETLAKMAAEALEQGDHVKSVDLYNRAIVLARSLDDRPRMADMLRMLAFAKEELGEDIGDILEESLTISRKIKDFPGTTRSLIQLGEYYAQKRKYHRSRKYYTQAIDIASHINDFALEALAWEGIGDLAFADENWREAHEAYEHSLGLYAPDQQPESQARILHKMGQALFYLGKLSEAANSFQTSSDLNKHLGDYEAYAAGLYGLARIAVEENRFTDAQQLSKSALDILKQIGSEYADELESEISNWVDLHNSEPVK